MNKIYIGLTIGPVYKTLSNAKKTGELWSGSYLFSYIMREIIREFKDKEKTVVLPAIEDNLFLENKEAIYQGAGFFPDRFIFEKENGDLEKLQNRVDTVIEKLAGKIDSHFKIALSNAEKKVNDDADNLEFYKKKVKSLKDVQGKKSEIENYLKEYLQIHYFEKEPINHVIDELYPILDMLELKQGLVPREEINYLSVFMQNINGSFFKNDASIKGETFPSLPFIATKELHKKIDNDALFKDSIDDTTIYDVLEADKKIKLKKHHKYIAIVHADGDSIGSLISTLKDDEFQPFNKKLLDFTSSSNEIVKDYGGSVVYAGGDDLLFFAPVVSDKGHIFELLKSIREKFDEKIQNDSLSVSFGLSISYYKYPLNEALKASVDALEYAKGSGKNSTTMKLQQHSGQYVQTTIKHSSPSYEEFENLTKEYLEIEDEKAMLSSFHHTIRKFEDVLKAIGKDPVAVENFFENNFNDAHKGQYIEFTNKLVNYIQTIFSEEKDEKKAIDRLYTSLKIIKFLKGEEI